MSGFGRELVLSLGLPAEPMAVHTARRHVAWICDRWSIAADAAQSLAVVVAELSTNAVRHAGGAFRLILRRNADRVLVEVEDAVACPPPRSADPGTQAESGRGLLVVERLALAWGCEPLPFGKRMWALVAA